MTQWGLDVLFNPAKRHMDEEKRRLQSTREEIGDSSGGKRIDLESGKVVIERPADADGADADTADTAESVATEPGGEPASGAGAGTGTAPAAPKAKAKTASARKNSTARTAAAERGAERHRRARAQGQAGRPRP